MKMKNKRSWNLLKDTKPKEITPTIYCHALVDISTPQTLKIEGYIKKKR
jgi:hypothetical protein